MSVEELLQVQLDWPAVEKTSAESIAKGLTIFERLGVLDLEGLIIAPDGEGGLMATYVRTNEGHVKGFDLLYTDRGGSDWLTLSVLEDDDLTEYTISNALRRVCVEHTELLSFSSRIQEVVERGL